MKGRLIWWSVVILIIASTSCKKENPEPIDLGLEYYPANVGTYRIYDVDSIVMNDFTKKTDTFSYQVRDEIIERYETANNTYRYRVHRQFKFKDQNWVDSYSWSFYRDNYQVEETSRNLPVVKLVFPVAKGVSWNANTKNTLDRQDYTIIESSEEKKINGIAVSEVIEIEQFRKTDPLQLNTEIGVEQYAKGIGLVYKLEHRAKRFTTGEPGVAPIDSGLIYIMQINTYSIK